MRFNLCAGLCVLQCVKLRLDAFPRDAAFDKLAESRVVCASVDRAAVTYDICAFEADPHNVDTCIIKDLVHFLGAEDSLFTGKGRVFAAPVLLIQFGVVYDDGRVKPRQSRAEPDCFAG